MSGSIALAFDAELQAQSSLTHVDVPRQFPARSPLMPVRVPPLEQCKFYDLFAADPQQVNELHAARRQEIEKQIGMEAMMEMLLSGKHHELHKHRQYDFRLNSSETQRLQRHSFVVSERLAAESFAEQYYRLYTDDMPVFVTSDSLLHAWHRSFDAFLVHFEEKGLQPLLLSILEKARRICSTLAATENSPGLRGVLHDVDTYLAVAQCLLEGKTSATDALDAAEVTALVQAVNRQQLGTATLFSCPPRDVDFSLFTPRGHYTKSTLLRQFFKAMTWLGTIDFRIDSSGDAACGLRQLQCACLLVHVLREADVMVSVDAIQTAVSTIAGDGFGADSMTPLQLHTLLGDRDILAIYCGPDSDTSLQSLQDEITNQRLGIQAIAGHPLVAPVSGSSRLPTSFAFFGQQFVWSAFVFSKLVFDQVLHDGAKVARRIPSAVDAAFTLFANDVAGQVITHRMQATSETSEDFVPFRDGLPYASNLLAMRRLIDAQLADADPKTCSLALLWQLALRELSAKSASDADVFQSDAWKKRQMNTQIASFAQLRHDTILYAKQSFTCGTLCEYAAGYVDPYPAFWTRLQQLADRTVSVVASVQALIAETPKMNLWNVPEPSLTKRASCFTTFASVATTLHEISVAQSLKQELTQSQSKFLKRIIEEEHGSGGSRYLGWYPSLFFTEREDSGKQDHLVADVHTDSPSAEHGDPGGVLHLGVGDVNLGFFIVDKVMYAGPVFSSYEFVTDINVRLTDDDFSKAVKDMDAPRWARESFLVDRRAGPVPRSVAVGGPRKRERFAHTAKRLKDKALSKVSRPPPPTTTAAASPPSAAGAASPSPTVGDARRKEWLAHLARLKTRASTNHSQHNGGGNA